MLRRPMRRRRSFSSEQNVPRTTVRGGELRVSSIGTEVMTMAKLQRYFEQFHEKIRADYDMNKTLREKKDIILNRIRKHLKENGRPSFDELLQGSYRMGTGV